MVNPAILFVIGSVIGAILGVVGVAFLNINLSTLAGLIIGGFVFGLLSAFIGLAIEGLLSFRGKDQDSQRIGLVARLEERRRILKDTDEKLSPFFDLSEGNNSIVILLERWDIVKDKREVLRQNLDRLRNLKDRKY